MSGAYRLALTCQNRHVKVGVSQNDRENAMTHELSPELETIGLCDFGGRLKAAMTAHPKCDPVTGELHFFGYDVRPPYLTYYRLSASGELVCGADIAIPGPSLLHDFAITEHYAVFLDLPITFRIRLALRGSTLPYMWDARHRARLGLMRLEKPPPRRWGVIDPTAGVIVDEQLDDRSVEVPTIDDERVGRRARYRYAMSGWNARGAIVKYDTELGTTRVHDLGHDTLGGESVFVGSAAPGRAEDDGWLLTIVTRRDGSASRLLVLDATDPSKAPVATIALPRAVPAGFHGSFVPDSYLEVIR